MPRNENKARADELPEIDSLWDFNDPAGTEAKLRDVLPAARESRIAPYLAQLLTQIARSEGLQRRFDDAHATLDEADGLIGDGMTVARVRSLLERGRVFNSNKQPGKARPLFLAAWESASSSGEDFYAVDAAHMLGIVDQGDDSLAWNEKAIALAERSNNEKANGWLGSLYNNTGWTYHEMSRFADALHFHEKNLAWHEQHEKTDKARVAKWCIARTLRSLNRVEEALARQRGLLNEHEALGTSDGYVHEELGECLLHLERAAEAAPHFARSFELLSADPWLTANESERLERLKKLGSP
ncbi:MAG: hypothetical protein IID33_00350 [Planctomycetes bacterium]|nr:hypothetical protein [Planctomycetota bacterium]